jgi:hypothetical protein
MILDIPLPQAAGRRALFELNLRHMKLAPDIILEDMANETEVHLFYSDTSETNRSK